MKKYVVCGVTESVRPYLPVEDKEFDRLIDAMTYAARMAETMIKADVLGVQIIEETDGKEGTYWTCDADAPGVFACHPEEGNGYFVAIADMRKK